MGADTPVLKVARTTAKQPPPSEINTPLWRASMADLRTSPVMKVSALVGIIGLLLSMFGSPFATTTRVTAVEAKQQALEARQEKSDQTDKETLEFMRSVDRRLSRMEGKMGIPPSPWEK